MTKQICDFVYRYLDKADEHGGCPVVGSLQQETVSTAGACLHPHNCKLSTVYLNQTDEHGGCPVVGSLKQETVSTAGAFLHTQQL